MTDQELAKANEELSKPFTPDSSTPPEIAALQLKLRAQHLAEITAQQSDRAILLDLVVRVTALEAK